MRIMAIDYGDARTGIAVSDALGLLAGEAFVLTEWSPERVADKIAAEAKKREVGTVVLGYPKNMDGSLGPRAEKSEALAKLLREAHGLDVVLWDERRTTVDAHRILSEAGVSGKKRKGTVDAVAATLILEGYLGSLKR
jgi:putative Holliday junction resolvase